MLLKAFISYSHHDRQIAAQVKDYLKDYNIESFLAHEDINVSQEWKNRIIKELNQVSIFIPLLSDAFKKSEWAPQEIGFAYKKRNMLIIPLSIDETNPFGFISDIQGKKIPTNGDYYDLLVEPIITRFPHAIIPKLIERLAGARDFRTAEKRMSALVSHFPEFDNAEILNFIDASIKNGQIWDAADCKREYIPQFLEMHRSKIPAAKLRKIRSLIKYPKTQGKK